MDKHTDLLAQYRQKPTVGSKRESYVAFEGKDRVDRLIIHRIADPSRSPNYIDLKDIAFDGPYGTNFALLFDHIIVLVRGKNLQPVIKAIQKGFAEFIQPFDPDIWEIPTDESAPFIESLKIVGPDGSPPAGESAPTATHH